MGEGELKQDIALFFKENAIIIAVIFAVIILVTLVVFLMIYFKKKTKDNISNISSNEFINCLGGKDNILESSATRSRLTLKLKDVNKLDEENIKKFSVTSIIKMSNKVTLVVEDNAEKLLAKLK